jgi:ABC-2 type transport system ATP-binding protein
LITINRLEVTYGKQLALSIKKPISFVPGDRVGIIGSNGAGKTTMIKAILGMIPYAGTIDTQLSPEEIAVHMQQNNYVNTMSVQSVMETILNRKLKSDPVAQELIRFFEFNDCLHKKYRMLSGGQKQRMTIILVLVQEAPLVFMDEVTSGLDFETRQRLMEKLVEWYKDKKTALCIVSHYYEELEQLVDKLLILEKGQVVDYGKKEELFRKYCGKTIIVLDNTEKNRRLVTGFDQLEAPAHLLAISCQEEATERSLTDRLCCENVNYKRSNSDIEILSINAKAKFESKRRGER